LERNKATFITLDSVTVCRIALQSPELLKLSLDSLLWQFHVTNGLTRNINNRNAHSELTLKGFMTTLILLKASSMSNFITTKSLLAQFINCSEKLAINTRHHVKNSYEGRYRLLVTW